MPSDYFLVVDIVNLMLHNVMCVEWNCYYACRVACCWCPTILCGE